MSVAYFCMFENTARTATRVEIRAVQPEPVVEPPGWIPRYVVPLDTETRVEGAEVLLARMNRAFAAKAVARGLYAVAYAEARNWVDEQLAKAAGDPQPPIATQTRHDAALYAHVSVRVLASIAAAVLFCVSLVANFYAIVWMIVIGPFRRRSLLYMAAEDRLMFYMLDWTKQIEVLVRIALRRMR
jgi:hypothetical protein